MTEMQDFELRFAERLRAYAAPAGRRAHAEALTRAVAAGREARRGLMGRLTLPTLHVLRYGIVAALVLLGGVLALSIWVGGGNIGPGAPSPSPSPTRSPLPLPASIPLSAGTYLYDHHAFTDVPFTFTVPEGWVVQNGGWNINIDGQDELGLASALLNSVNADACAEGTTQADAGSTIADLVNALLDQSGTVFEDPIDVSIGGYQAKRLDVAAPVGANLEGCNAPGGLQLWRDQAGNYFVIGPDWRTSIYLIDVDGERVVLMAVHQATSAPADVAELDAVIQSIEFHP